MNEQALIWIGVYLFVAAFCFGVMCAAFDETERDVGFRPILFGSFVWPLTLIAAIAYAITQWLNRRRK